MFAIKSAFRQVTARPSTLHLRLVSKFLSTGAPEKTNAAARVLDRVKYFVWTNYPSRALAYFHNELSSGRVPVRDRAGLYEAVIRVFVQNGLPTEAENVLNRLEASEHIVSTPLHVMVTTHELLSGKITRKIFLSKIGKIVSSPSYNENMFIGLLNHLYRVGCSGETLHEVTNRYVASKTLGPKGVSTLLHYLVQKKQLRRAGEWVDYHAEKVRSRRGQVTSADSEPYTNYMVGLLGVAKPANAGEVYIPILQKMIEDGAWPDIHFLNAAVAAEKEHGRVGAVMHLYNIIRTLSDKGVLPTDATFACAFSAFLKSPSNSDSPTSPRELFSDMVSAHIVASKRNYDATVTSVSLSPALLLFTTTQDYAAACRALKAYRSYHCPLTELIVRKIVTLFASRCYEALRLQTPSQRTAWVIAFMGLGTEARRRAFRHASIRDIHRRILDLARHDFPDAPKDEEPVQDDDTVPGASSVPARSVVREKRVKRMRENKLAFVHTLLLRALSASFAAEGRSMDAVRQQTKQALIEASRSMSPSEADAMQSKFAECPLAQNT